MFSGYQSIFWGLFFITFHINFGSFQLLPNLIGWAIIVSGINKLGTVCQNVIFTKAAYLALAAVLYSVFNLIYLLMNPFTGSYSPFMILCFVFISVVELLVEYFIINGSAEYLYGNNYTDAAEELLKQLRNYMVFYFINTVIICFAFTLNLSLMAFICAISGIILRICFIAMISRLKNANREEIGNNC